MPVTGVQTCALPILYGQKQYKKCIKSEIWNKSMKFLGKTVKGRKIGEKGIKQTKHITTRQVNYE